MMRSRSAHDVQARRRRSAFTLLEAVLALFLMILLLTGVFGFYQTTLRVREDGKQVARDVMLSRAILERMAEEIRHASSIVPGDGIGFEGEEERIMIVCTRIPERYAFNEYDSVSEELPPAQLDLRRIEYRLYWDAELEDDEGVAICHGMFRAEQKTFDPNPRFVVKTDEEFDVEADQPVTGPQPEKPELIAPEIKYVRFEYFDGAKWRDRWNVPYEQQEAEQDEEGIAVAVAKPGRGEYALPQAVKITIGQICVPREADELDISVLKDEKQEELEEYHADRFTIVVQLRQADPSLLSSLKHGIDNQPELQLGGEQ